MADISPEKRDYHAVMRLIYRLPYQRQLDVLNTLSEYLAGEFGVEVEQSKELRERQEALADLRRAIDWLGPEIAAPTIKQYEAAATALDLSHSSREIIRAFERWSNAQKAISGGRVAETPTQRALRRATSGRERSAETHLHGVARWLATPDLVSETRADYDEYVRFYNAGLRDAELSLVGSSAVMAAFPLLVWAEVLAGARGQIDPYELKSQRAEELVAEAENRDGLLPARTVGALLGIRCHEPSVLARQGKIPPPLTHLGTVPVWLAEDVRGHRAGQPIPDRSEHPLIKELIGTAELGRLLGRRPGSILTALHQKRTTVPVPAGNVDRTHYWMRSQVKQWCQDRGRTYSDSI